MEKFLFEKVQILKCRGTTELGIAIFADFSTATLLYPEQSEDVQELDKVIPT